MTVYKNTIKYSAYLHCPCFTCLFFLPINFRALAKNMALAAANFTFGA